MLLGSYKVVSQGLESMGNFLYHYYLGWLCNWRVQKLGNETERLKGEKSSRALS